MATLSKIDFLDDGNALVTWTDGTEHIVPTVDVPLLVADEFGLTLRVVCVKNALSLKHVDFTPMDR